MRARALVCVCGVRANTDIYDRDCAGIRACERVRRADLKLRLNRRRSVCVCVNVRKRCERDFIILAENALQCIRRTHTHTGSGRRRRKSCVCVCVICVCFCGAN